MAIFNPMLLVGAAKGEGVPSGGIILWSGAAEDIPEGWALCDGTNGTPDLRDRFVVGAGNAYALGAAGGEAAHTLTVNEMPRHAHQIEQKVLTQNGGGSSFSSSSGAVPGYATVTTGAVGGSLAHNNLPPYYALCYIMLL